MLLALFCSITAWICFIIGACGVSKSASVLQRVPWTDLHWHDTHGLGVRLDVLFGVTAVYSRSVGVAPENATSPMNVLSPDFVIEKTFAFKDACPYIGKRYTSPESHEQLREFCELCKKSSARTMGLIFISVVFQFFQVRKNLQRVTPFGDFNCQKFMGWAAAICSLLAGMFSIASYLEGCWRHFPRELELKVIDPTTGGPIEIPAKSQGHTLGIGVSFMLTAVCLKFIDFLAHFSLRTPPQKQQHADPSIPFVDYCYLNYKPTRYGQVIKAEAIKENQARYSDTISPLRKAPSAPRNTRVSA